MKKKCLLLFVIMAVVSVFCMGCNNTKNSEVALAVVAGVHSNAMEIPLNSISIKEAVYNSCYTYGSVSFISVDGNPKVYYQASIPKPAASGLTENKKESIANAYTEQLLGEITQARPETAEVDTLKAIQQASLALSSGPETADRVMVVMDSGLSTLGYLDFTKGLLDADIESIIDALKASEAIPDLQDITVIWMFNGQTASPQPELSEKQKKKLQEIWRAVLLAGGAKEIEFTSDIASDVPDNDYPEVSIVDVESREIDVEIQERQHIGTVILDNASVQFIGNQAVFVDKELAMITIKELAQQLLNHPNNKVYVIGTTASGDREFCEKLSIDRAQAVVDVLVDFGVPKSQLIPMGLGCEDPWHIDDLDENGRQIEEQACQNRKVMIVDVNGIDAEKIE